MGRSYGQMYTDTGGHLATCSRCDWRRFITDVNAHGSRCPQHPDATDLIPDGTPVRVRCFTHRCPNPSVDIVYTQLVGPDDLRCPDHLT